MKTKTDGTRFIHVHDPDSPRGGFTVAYRVGSEDDDGRTVRVFWGVAVCSPRDQFSRKIGRAIAQGRLTKNPQTAIVPSESLSRSLVSHVGREIARYARGCYSQKLEDELRFILREHLLRSFGINVVL